MLMTCSATSGWAAWKAWAKGRRIPKGTYRKSLYRPRDKTTRRSEPVDCFVLGDWCYHRDHGERWHRGKLYKQSWWTVAHVPTGLKALEPDTMQACRVAVLRLHDAGERAMDLGKYMLREGVYCRPLAD